MLPYFLLLCLAMDWDSSSANQLRFIVITHVILSLMVGVFVDGFFKVSKSFGFIDCYGNVQASQLSAESIQKEKA